LGVSTLDEALALRAAGILGPILLLGERTDAELPWCVENDFQVCVSRLETAQMLAQLAETAGKRILVHVKVDTGMSRYGVRWTEALGLLEAINTSPSIILEGVMSHFAMSDEKDKTFALLQLSRFQEVLDQMRARGIRCRLRHMCNSGGFLDLPQAHFEMVRVGLLALGVYPSQVCRRLDGLQPVMEVKSQIAALQTIQAGDSIGYGMRFTAAVPMRVGVLPLGYGDGFPRIRNQGQVLVRGKCAPIVGSNAMDAILIDLTSVPEAQLWDEVVLLGRQGAEEISVHDIARWGSTVSYDILSGWRARLPRRYLGAER
jgi:alanine racemase